MTTDIMFLDDRYDDGAYRKQANSVRIVELDFAELIANYWRPGFEYATSDVVRPRRPTGFAYQSGGNGQSHRREPRWPTTLSGTVTDGSITWTAIAAGGNGVDDLSSPAAAVAPSGVLTATSLSVVEETRVRLTLSGGVSGGGSEVRMPNGDCVTGYTVTVTVTTDAGETLVGSLVVVVLPR